MSGAVLRDLQLAQQALPSVRLLRGDSVALEPVRWLWDGYIPAGMLTILGGAPGCGKTTLALAVAAVVTRAGRWPDGTQCSQPGEVIIWSGEDPPTVTAARLMAAGADMEQVHFVEGMSDGQAFDPGRDMPFLEATAEGLAAPRLLILDPIVSAVAGDSHKGAEVRRSLQPVVDLARRLGCAVLGITHFSKGTSGRDPVERVTGSIAFAALARVVLVVAKEQADEGDESRRVLVRAKSNVGPDDGGFAYSLDRLEVAPGVEGQRVVWLEPLKGSARDVVAEAEANPEGDEEASALEESMQFLRSELREGPKPARTIFKEARDAGHSERTVKRAKAKLQVESIKRESSWMWVLPAKGAKGANSANDSEGLTDGLLGQEAKGASDSSLGNLGPLGSLGTLDPLADDGEVF
ncbi:AAA family ATPase [Piscinibacter sp. Jin2]|uniref:AAA family ATPase n=1 Tax=Aquariibacter lacus TaxID=2801332 RepID=A0A9X1BRP7_9BURK|nr:AAA family ATPase [Piscinibacter lacus]MBL0719808.1 AAA family ATPase [Piscinibacter lacus]